MKARILVAASLAILSTATDAECLCYYGGKHFTKGKDGDDFDRRLYATTTLADEFQDSALVIKGTVTSSREVPLPASERDAGVEYGVVYRIRVDQTFKGQARKKLDNFTERDSGGFYLDKGGAYLLFLKPMDVKDSARRVAAGALRVNYNCGQSRLWGKISRAEIKQLNFLAAQH